METEITTEIETGCIGKDDCYYCFDTITLDRPSLVPCHCKNQRVHIDCWVQWLNATHHKQCCPICKANWSHLYRLECQAPTAEDLARDKKYRYCLSIMIVLFIAVVVGGIAGLVLMHHFDVPTTLSTFFGIGFCFVGISLLMIIGSVRHAILVQSTLV